MGQVSGNSSRSESVDDWNEVNPQSSAEPSSANPDPSPVMCSSPEETKEKGFWRGLADDLLAQDFTPIFITLSDPLFPMFLRPNKDAVPAAAGELHWNLDLNMNQDLFFQEIHSGSYGIDETLDDTGFPCTVPEETIVEDVLKDPAVNLQTCAHSWSYDDDVHYSDDPYFNRMPYFQPTPFNQETPEDKKRYSVLVEFKINGQQYEVGKRLGGGGFGVVFEGVGARDGLPVALKIYFKTKNYTDDYIKIPGFPEVLPREIGLHMLASTGEYSPLIIKLLDWQEYSEYVIMVLELPTPCENLLMFINHNGGKVSENTAKVIFRQVTEASEICFKRGVFHRDIKLENVLINPNTLEVKMIDFGAGDLFTTSPYKEFIGTRVYACPELFQNKEYHAKPATVYSLGVVLFTISCGKYPSDTDLLRISEKRWKRDDLTPECCDLIQACLQKNPDERIDLQEIPDHAWFTDKDLADNLQALVPFGSSDIIRFPDDAGSDFNEDQNTKSHPKSPSQETLKVYEDSKVIIIRAPGRQNEDNRTVDDDGLEAVKKGIRDSLKVAAKVIFKTTIKIIPILLKMIC